MKKVTFAEIYSLFSLLVIIFFVIVETIYRGNATLEIIVSVLFAIKGFVGLISFSCRKPKWRVFDILANVFWLLFGLVMLYMAGNV